MEEKGLDTKSSGTKAARGKKGNFIQHTRNERGRLDREVYIAGKKDWKGFSRRSGRSGERKKRRS